VAIASAGARRTRANLDERAQADRRERVLPARVSVAVWLIAIAGLSVALRIVLLTEVHGPWVFMDELGYQKLAQSLGQNGHLALFDKRGLSLSPLYSVVLAPIYAVGVSAPTAYQWIKIVNAVLMSLSIFPTYMIARFVLPRRLSLIAAALSALAPLMYYSALAMSENLAYPLFLASVWAMLVAVRYPSRRADAVLLLSIVAASAARLQLIILFPAALTAVVLARVFARKPAERYTGGLLSELWQQHRLLVGSAVGFLVVLGTGRAFALTGIYGGLLKDGFPNVWRVLEQIVRHLAGMDLAVGVIPFVGALVAAYAFLKYGAGRNVGVFASVAASVTAWVLLEVGFFGDYVVRTGQIPRIHERYFFYVLPLFVIALLAAVRLPASKAPFRMYEAAAVVAAALPAVIPFRSVINNSIVADSFALQPYGRIVGHTIVPIGHATLGAVFSAALFALLYLLIRNRTVGVSVLVLLVFVLMSSFVRSRVVESASGATASVLPAHRDWVDQANPGDGVALVAGPGASDLAVLETAFNNLSISRVYYVCKPAFGAVFGEQRIWADRAGGLHDAAGYLSAASVVVPAGLGVQGRVVARNRKGHLVLVAPLDGRVRVSAAMRGALNCGST
jgi:Dolichyl-phosphate-mannose-protein mannosyltransferase